VLTEEKLNKIGARLEHTTEITLEIVNPQSEFQLV
jgi:hypothetical protein